MLPLAMCANPFLAEPRRKEWPLPARRKNAVSIFAPRGPGALSPDSLTLGNQFPVDPRYYGDSETIGKVTCCHLLGYAEKCVGITGLGNFQQKSL